MKPARNELAIYFVLIAIALLIAAAVRHGFWLLVVVLAAVGTGLIAAFALSGEEDPKRLKGGKQ